MFQPNTKEDTILIWNLRKSKCYGAPRLIRECSDKNWKGRGIKKLLRRVHETGLLDFLQEATHHTYRAAVWFSLDQSLIDDAADQWPAHLQACV